MTVRLTLEAAQSLRRLKAPEFEPLIHWLEQVHLEALHAMAEVSDENTWRKLQGRAQIVQQLLENVRSSDTLVVKLK